jgi:cytochrome b subunit of formate dehydrogenase
MAATGRIRQRLLILVVLVGVVAWVGGTSRSSLAQPSNDDCLVCHVDENLTGVDASGNELRVFVDPEVFAGSVHGGLSCVDCHSDVTSTEHPPELQRVDCAACHTDVAGQVLASDHGKRGLPGAAACLACHGEAHGLLAAVDPASPIHRSNIPKQCATCHDRPEPPVVSMADPIGSYARTVHGRALLERGNLAAATCTDCHTAHAINAPANAASSVHRANIAATCAQCHQAEAALYTESIHGRAIARGSLAAATCTDCHGEHTILAPEDPASTVFATTISRETCAACHAAERLTEKFGIPSGRVESYRQSYHGLAAEMGGTTVANCASCHGIHDILPSSDPRSSVNSSRLPMTCGKCHAGVSSAVLTGLTVHGGVEGGAGVVRWVAWFYRVMIPLVIGAMLLHHGLDFARKLGRRLRERRVTAGIRRWTRIERAEHWVLFVAFAALAYSGFVIRYPHAAWAAPFHWLGGEGFRSSFHRAFALAFVLLGAFHLVRATLTGRGRRMLSAFAFRASDVRQLREFVSGSIPDLPEPAEPARFTYMAKVEYWALVWGTVIMTLTGAALVFKDWTLAHLPGWMPDFCTNVHFYEAVLATLAVLVWHLYRVIFDPDVYPLEPAMVTGVSGHAAVRQFASKATEIRVRGETSDESAPPPPS